MIVRENFADLGRQLVMRLFPFASRHEHDEEMRMVGRTMRKRLHKRYLRKRLDAFRDFRCQLCGFLQRAAFGQRVGADQLSLVIRGNPVASHQMVEAEGREERQPANHQDGATMGQRPMQGLEIELFDGMQESFGMGLLLAAT